MGGASAAVTGRNWTQNVSGRKKDYVFMFVKGLQHVQIGHFLSKTFEANQKKTLGF